jgi:hypothetical protein
VEGISGVKGIEHGGTSVYFGFYFKFLAKPQAVLWNIDFLPIIIDWGGYGDHFLCHRMFEFQNARVQGDGTQPVVLVLGTEGDFGTVLGVAQQGIAPGGGLDADLVRAPGFQTDFQPRSPGANA